MKPSTTLKPFIYLLMLLVALTPLTACAPSPEQIAAQTATAQTAIAALWTPTPTFTTVPTSTATPTNTPSPTPTQEPTLTPTPTAASSPRTSITIKGVTFSLIAPEGWKKTEDPNRAILTGPTLEGTQLILTLSLDHYEMMGTPLDGDEFGISLFSAHVQDTISGMTKNVSQVSEDFLNTPEGKPYFRWVMEHNPNGKDLHQAFYIFGSGKWFLTAMYGRPKSAGAEYDPIVDEAMKTLMFAE